MSTLFNADQRHDLNSALTRLELYFSSDRMLSEDDSVKASLTKAILVIRDFLEPLIDGQSQNLVHAPTPRSIVLVDDDALIRSVWKIEAEQSNDELQAFSSFEDLDKHLSSMPYDTAFYVDVNLGNGENGTNAAARLIQMGFSNVNLTTGYEKESLTYPKEVRSVIGKHFPKKSIEPIQIQETT